MNKTSPKVFWKDWFNNRKRKLDWKALLVCVAIAFTLWLIGGLSNESSLDLHFTLNPVKFNEGCEVNHLDDLEINVTVQSKGFDLMNRWFQSTNTPVDLPLDKFPCKTGEIQISSNQLKSLLLPYLNDGLRITKMVPEVITIALLKKAERKLPVRANVSVEQIPGFKFTNRFLIVPDSIPIEGSSEVIDQLKHIKTTEKQLFIDLSDPVSLDIPEGLSSSVSSVLITPIYDTLLSRLLTLSPSMSQDFPNENTLFFPPKVEVEIIGTANELALLDLEKIHLKTSTFSQEANIAHISINYSGKEDLLFILDTEFVQFLAIE